MDKRRQPVAYFNLNPQQRKILARWSKRHDELSAELRRLEEFIGKLLLWHQDVAPSTGTERKRSARFEGKLIEG